MANGNEKLCSFTEKIRTQISFSLNLVFVAFQKSGSFVMLRGCAWHLFPTFLLCLVPSESGTKGSGSSYEWLPTLQKSNRTNKRHIAPCPQTHRYTVGPVELQAYDNCYTTVTLGRKGRQWFWEPISSWHPGHQDLPSFLPTRRLGRLKKELCVAVISC